MVIVAQQDHWHECQLLLFGCLLIHYARQTHMGLAHLFAFTVEQHLLPHCRDAAVARR